MAKKSAAGTSAAPTHSEVRGALEQIVRDRAVERIWSKDYTLWKPDPTEIDNRLGWLDVSEQMQEALSDLTGFAASVQAEGIRDVVLLGMGGSSLGPEVLRSTFKPMKGFPRLWVLDSTVPGWVRQVTDAINPSRTLFIVASKSGGTIEVMSLLAHFRSLVSKTKGNRGGSQFIAITDPGTGLETLALEQQFLRTFSNPADIGGRYSVLSYFGLVPAALTGIDIGGLLERAISMAQLCRQPAPADQNPGALLGATMAAHAQAGRDKMTLITSPGINSFGLWVEQLLAESTGKEDRGLIPIANEPLGKPDMYGDDRLFIYLRLRGDANDTTDAHVAALERAGHPVVTLKLRDRLDVGGEFFRWEFATAVAGYLLGINPFDQPNVQESKDNTSRVLKQVKRTGALPASPTMPAHEAVTQLISQAAAGRYVAILAYMTPTKDAERALAAVRKSWLAGYRLASTAGYGPRYLHSTGQLHKGGPNSGLFLELVESMKPDVPIPGQSYTFATLAQAQALGDLQSLRSHGRAAVRLDLGRQPVVALRSLAAVIAASTRPSAGGSRAARRSNRSRRSA